MEELKAQILDLPTISVKIENVEVNNAVKGDYIPNPESAEIGQTVVVKSVDENGKPTEWEAADFLAERLLVKANNWRKLRQDKSMILQIKTVLDIAPFRL